ncbi:MAG: hypothetical protein JO119_08570 [Acidobacteria bacterium]|nr:hypothetical protein [Acidobacteriota bacterium]
MSVQQSNPTIIVIGGHTRGIGKTQLVCDIISAVPEANWIAGKITQYGHGVCARNGHDCNCALDEHVCALDWERHANTGTDSSRFLAAGAQRSFWLRTKQGFLAEGMPLLRTALDEIARDRGRNNGASSIHVILESNTLLQFLRPDLFLMVLHPGKSDFKDSALLQLDRSSAFVLREPIPTNENGEKAATSWRNFPLQVLRANPIFVQREAEPLPLPLLELIRAVVCNDQKTPSINV